MRLAIYSSTLNLPELPHLAPALQLNRILVVDDVALNREILIAHLGNTARYFDEAADGLAALTLFKERHYDAVLLDIEMPRLDGYDALVELRRWEQEQHLPPVPVVAITSNDFPEDEQRILGAGATVHLVKPVKRPELMAALHLHCITEQDSNPMANLLPRFFASAHDMLDEMTSLADSESISKSLHNLSGITAIFGFVEFTKHLKRILLGVRQGKMPSSTEFDLLRKELQQLETVAREQS